MTVKNVGSIGEGNMGTLGAAPSRVKRGLLTALLLVTTTAVITGGAQARTGVRRSFDVVSIKPAESQSELGRGLRLTPTGFLAEITLRELILYAYNIKTFQLSGGPGWVATERYAVQARSESPLDVADAHLMLQALLEERFGLMLRREMKELPVYALEVVRMTDRLRVVDAGESPQARISMFRNNGAMFMRLTGEKTTMAQVADVLTAVLLATGRPVVNRTGLSQHFDFTLDWAADETASDGASTSTLPALARPRLEDAIREQLGLRLNDAQAPMEAFVIQSVSRPTPN